MTESEVRVLIDRISFDLYGMSRAAAIEKRICVDCRKSVPENEADWSEMDWIEWGTSALCPQHSVSMSRRIETALDHFDQTNKERAWPK
jgi:hypothetical protein